MNERIIQSVYFHNIPNPTHRYSQRIHNMQIKDIVKHLISKVAHILCKQGLIRRQIVIRMDGGICSQMHFYLVGEMLRRHGNNVSYDLTWYKTTGVDLDGRFCRNYDLTKLFPKLKLEEISPKLLKQIYISCFYKHMDYSSEVSYPNVWMKYKSPLYLDGYFHDTDEMFGDIFSESFEIDSNILDESNKNILAHIQKSGKLSCAIHVRRGDLAKYNSAYGNPIELSYFLKAISYIDNETERNATYFIFSDEPDWCNKMLIPHVEDRDVIVCDINGSDKGYYDLILMSNCHHQITSQGSMGKYAALLRDKTNDDGLVVLPANKNSSEWVGRFNKSIIVSS